MINLGKDGKIAQTLIKAINGGDEKEISQAWGAFEESVVEKVKEQFAGIEATADANILAQRGIRQLTTAERNFYEKMIETAKSSNPKQAFTDLLTLDGGMPETIIEDVYKDLEDNHPLLSKINFTNVKYLTTWLLTDGSVDTAVWGEINAEITKQIEASFKNISMTQGKLSAYVLIAKDMLELGANFLDAYIRRILAESIALGLENGIINGKGVKGEPIGLIKSVAEDVEVHATNGYPNKEAIAVTSFTPAEYGALVANLAVKENGKPRKLNGVTLLCNTVDYLTKIMPATTVLTANGEYKNNLFPYPTDVIETIALETGTAVLFLPSEYFMGVGAGKKGVIEYSDEFKFLEDVRTYKTKMFAYGRANDDTVAIVLDITNLEPAYITVMNKEVAVATTQEATPTV